MCNAEPSLLKAHSRQAPVQFAKMNGNSSVTTARRGQRLNDWRPDHRNRLKEEAPRPRGNWHRARFCYWPARFALCGRRMEICFGIASRCSTKQPSKQIKARGGIRAIAISHPHFYSTMVEWAERFDAQIFLHAKDRHWVMRKSPRIQFWEETMLSLWDGLMLINCGGHFEGGTVLHWPARRKWQRGAADWRHHSSGARSPICEFHAELSEPDSARTDRNPPNPSENRKVPIRTNLRRVVGSEPAIGRQSGGATLGGTLFARDQRVIIATVHGRRKLWRQLCRLL